MRSRFSILSLGVSLLVLPMALAQSQIVPPASAPVPYPLNVKPSTPQATLTGVPPPAPTQPAPVKPAPNVLFAVPLPSPQPAQMLPPMMPTVPPGFQFHTTYIPLAPAKPKTRVFEVADLVYAPLQIPGAAALENTKAANSHALMKLIVALVKPESWERHGGTGKIEFIAASDSICATNSPDVLADVAKMIESLRTLQDQQVTVEVRILTVPAGFGAKAGWPTQDDKGKAAPKFCSPNELKQAMELAMADKRVNVLSNPRMTCIDGQTGVFQMTQAATKVVSPVTEISKKGEILAVTYETVELGTTFQCTPTISMDGRFIQLKMCSTHVCPVGSSSTDINTLKTEMTLALPNGNSAITFLGKEKIEEVTETKMPVLSKVPYVNRLFRSRKSETVEQEVYQIVTARIGKQEVPKNMTWSMTARDFGAIQAPPCCKPGDVIGVDFSCPVPAPKPAPDAKQAFSFHSGWFGDFTPAPKVIAVPKQEFSHWIGWFGNQ